MTAPARPVSPEWIAEFRKKAVLFGENGNGWGALREAFRHVDHLEDALGNVRLLAMRLHRTDPANAEHFLRFCREVGVEGSVLRTNTEEPPE